MISNAIQQIRLAKRTDDYIHLRRFILAVVSSRDLTICLSDMFNCLGGAIKVYTGELMVDAKDKLEHFIEAAKQKGNSVSILIDTEVGEKTHVFIWDSEYNTWQRVRYHGGESGTDHFVTFRKARFFADEVNHGVMDKLLYLTLETILNHMEN